MNFIKLSQNIHLLPWSLRDTSKTMNETCKAPAKNKVDKDSAYKNLALFIAEPVYEGRL